ncbi:hypothetical protein F5884DRAFT_671763 [Xylogone sp. PMI_703]|nr:hypothetical protein F5884DRAFT_671763 [Xylogone sp. PMI_703]
MSCLDFIIVGAGYGGLSTAIELAQKGFKVKVYEAVKQLTNQGDVIMLSANATRIMAKWGNVLAQVDALASHPSQMILQDQNGMTLLSQELPSTYDSFPNVIAHRGETQRIMYEYAKSLGVDFQFDCRVTDYFEDKDGAGVIINEERHNARGVIAADGIHSKARSYVSGKQTTTGSSGFAVYRSWFPLERLKNDPLTRPLAESKKDQWFVWIGKDIHAIILTNITLQKCVCFCTHKDTYTIEESWSFHGKVEDMLQVVDGWDPVLRAAMKQVPQDELIDWKLLWRDPARKWVSDAGYICLTGDSAHPHLATSGSGAAQAIEDSATLGVVLDRLGRHDVPLAFQVYANLRFQRTSLTQRMGWETRHRWHQTPWEEVAKNPDALKLPQPAWLFGVDAAQYASDKLDEMVSHLKDGKPFETTNVPPGYVHEDWTVESMMAAEGSVTQYKVQIT